MTHLTLPSLSCILELDGALRETEHQKCFIIKYITNADKTFV